MLFLPFVAAAWSCLNSGKEFKDVLRQIIEDYYHEPGKHCASTALRDAFHFRGHELSEPFCFGLGRGLGALYLKAEGLSPSRWFMTRSGDLEAKFFEALSIPFGFKQAPDAGAAWELTKADLDSGAPLLLHTDLKYLDYYNTKTHFNRHAVLMWGYDEEKGTAYLSDTQYEGLMEIPLESLEKARSSDFPPGPVRFDWFPVRPPRSLPDLTGAALTAIGKNALEMTMEAQSAVLSTNLGAIRAAALDLLGWKNVDDWRWCARFAYQAIEKRGTGGSAFRKMYADFLREVEEMEPSVGRAGLSSMMDEISVRWSDLAACFKAVSERKEPAGFEECADKTMELHDMEKRYYGAVLENIDL